MIIRELLDTTIGAAAGSAASLTYKRVKHNTSELGGVRQVETRSVISRNSSAGDVTTLKAMFATDSKIATPANRAGTNWRA